MTLNLLKAFRANGTPAALFPVGGISTQDFPDDAGLIDEGLRRAALFDPDAPSLRVCHQWLMAESPGRGGRLGLCFTELDRLKPLEVHHLNSLDAVVQPSQWSLGVAARSGVTTEQVVVPCAVDAEVFWPDRLPSSEASSDETVFVNAGKWEYRKGHDVLLQAFLRAFGPRDKVRLVLLCDNPFLDKVQGDQWVAYYKNHPLGDKVEMVPRLKTQREVACLFRQAHCGVFPARAEGANLEAMELAAMGRHVILTDYSGHTGWAAEAGCLSVGVDEFEPAHDGVWFFRNDPAWGGDPGRWAVLGDAQVEGFAAHMRAVHEARLYGHLDLNWRGVEHFRRWTWAEAARRILDVAIR